MMNKNFIENGYIIIKMLSGKTNKEMQNIVLKILDKNNKKNTYKVFCSLIEKKKSKLFELNKEIHSAFIYEKIFQKIFTNKKFFSFLTSLLGKDLSFLDEPSVVVNVPTKFLKKKLLF